MHLSVCIAVGPNETFAPLHETLDSIARQVGSPVEVVVKTLGDHLADEMRRHAQAQRLELTLLTGADAGIYDAMNRCVASARGCYVIFLGCGDVLVDNDVARDLAAFSAGHGEPEVIYGGVLLADPSGRVASSFNNACFFRRRARLPWRNPCHSQGLVYNRRWIERHPFRTTIGPLADLVHTYEHHVYEIARWIDRPLSVFRSGGVSNRRDVAAFRARLAGLHANCSNFRFASLWRLASLAVCSIDFVRSR